jgi:hypothetical protein
MDSVAKKAMVNQAWSWSVKMLTYVPPYAVYAMVSTPTVITMG